MRNRTEQVSTQLLTQPQKLVGFEVWQGNVRPLLRNGIDALLKKRSHLSFGNERREEIVAKSC
jgi:hypothetical protein